MENFQFIANLERSSKKNADSSLINFSYSLYANTKISKFSLPAKNSKEKVKKLHTFLATINFIKKIVNFAEILRPFSQILGMNNPRISKFLQTTFGFNPSHHNLRVEIIAGITTFLTMA